MRKSRFTEEQIIKVLKEHAAKLPLPPETAQGQLPFEKKKADAIDEIEQQARELNEPEIPTGAPVTTN